jgi:hypothetical protein
MRITRRHRIVAAAAVALLVTPAACTRHPKDGTPVGAGGGTVSSGDHAVRVVFEPGQADDGTRVTVDTGGDGPPPPVAVDPLTRPFDITAGAGHIRAGRVTVHFGRLPDGISPATVRLFIDDGNNGWQALPTVLDTATGDATATFPHFTKGFFGTVSGWGGTVAGATGKAASWSWDKVKQGGRGIADHKGEIAKAVASVPLALIGGTTDSVKCDKKDPAWTFRGTNGEGGHMNFAPLTGCAEQAASSGTVLVRVGDRYPYPYLLSLPRGVVGPGWRDIAAGADLSDLLATMTWSRWDRVVVPGGNQTQVTFEPGASTPATLGGYSDPSTVALKILALLATIASAGDSAAIKAEVEAEWEALYAARAAATQAGRTDVTLAEVAERSGWDSALARKERKLQRSQAADMVDLVFATVDLLNCGFRVIETVARGETDAGKFVWSLVTEMVKKCWAPWASKAAPAAVDAVARQLDGEGQAEMTKALAAALVDQVQDLPGIAGAVGSAVANVGTPFDYAHAELQVTGGGAFAPIPVPDAAGLARAGICDVPCKITGRVEFTHPAWGRVALVTTAPTVIDVVNMEGNIAVFDLGGQVRWKYRGDWLRLVPADPAIDKTGHIFLSYNPGRYDGLVVLDPAAGGFADFDSLPKAPDNATGAYYGGSAADLDHDGTYEIKVDGNTCDPNCASAHYVEYLFRWNGRDYEQYSSRRVS